MVRIIGPKKNIRDSTINKNDLFNYQVFQATYEIPQEFLKQENETITNYKNRLVENLNQQQDLTKFTSTNTDSRADYDLTSLVEQTHEELLTKREPLSAMKIGNHTTAVMYKQNNQSLLTLNSFSGEFGNVNINGINEFYKSETKE